MEPDNPDKPDIDPALVEQVADELAAKLEEARTEVRDRWWKGEVINITGYRFINCRFEECVLVFDWPNFELIDCALPGTDLMPKRTHEQRQSSASS